jgi:hypothetical protein
MIIINGEGWGGFERKRSSFLQRSVLASPWTETNYDFMIAGQRIFERRFSSGTPKYEATEGGVLTL